MAPKLVQLLYLSQFLLLLTAIVTVNAYQWNRQSFITRPSYRNSYSNSYSSINSYNNNNRHYSTANSDDVDSSNSDRYRKSSNERSSRRSYSYSSSNSDNNFANSNRERFTAGNSDRISDRNSVGNSYDNSGRNSDSNSGSNDDETEKIPRLAEDTSALIQWITDANGLVNAAINTNSNSGWKLYTQLPLLKDAIVAIVPKSLCISSDMSKMHTKLSPNAVTLINSLNGNSNSNSDGSSKRNSHLWRAKLAIALLSERVRPNSNYHPYLRNLPFEYWGLPMFFSQAEFR